MEKPSLVCGFLGGHHAAANIDQQNHPNVAAESAAAINTIRPPLLRRVSQSDPHLDIPHFVNAKEKSLSKKLFAMLSLVVFGEFLFYESIAFGKNANPLVITCLSLTSFITNISEKKS